MNRRFVVDNCTIVNFAVVDRLDLIRGVLVNAMWLAAVERELRQSARFVQMLDHGACRLWLGQPVELDELHDIAQVEKIRLGLGGTRRKPLDHLGEAQSIHAILTRSELAGAVFVTDDISAADMACRKKIKVWNTGRVLRACYDAGRIACPDAYDLVNEMKHTHGRGVRVPRDHTVVCP